MSSDPPPGAARNRTSTGDARADPVVDPTDVDAPRDGPADATDRDPAALRARLETLQAENERLRDAVATAHRRRYRVTALGLAAVGLVALAGAAAFPNVRTVLLALGGTGVFAAVLTYFLTPERFVAAAVGERVYGTLADNEAAIVDDLDLRGDPVVVPADGDAAPARVFVPLHADPPAAAEWLGGTVPDDRALATPFVTGDAQGLSLQPTGAPLYRELVDAAGTLPDEPAALASAVGDALVEQLELVDGVDPDVDPEDDRVTLSVSGSAYGPLHRFDHPVASVLATTLAVELDAPVAVTTESAHGDGDWLVTCRW